jgi:ABC-2 type transport system permease protein
VTAFQWSVRRELCENRAIYFGPLGAAAIFLLGFLASLIARPPEAVATEPYTYAMLVIMATAVVVEIFYCLDALYAERRDRSILLWKSLPVSDATTVMAKAAIVFVVLPLITIATTIALHFVMLMSSSLVLVVRGGDAGALWRAVAPLELAIRLTYHIMTTHVLWYAPTLAWLLFASAIARRAPLVWAGLPLLAIVVVERLVLGSSRFFDMLAFRTMGGPGMVADTKDLLGHADPGALVTSAGLWIGLAVSVVFLVAAIRVRRHNGPA